MKPEIVAVGIPGPFGFGGTSSSLQIQQDGVNVGQAAHTRQLNFTGNVDVSEYSGQVTVYVDADPSGAASEALVEAVSYTDEKATAAVLEAKTYADDVSTSAEVAAKSYAEAQDTGTLFAANEYADNAAVAAELSAKSYASTVAADAEVSAKAYAELLIISALKLRGGYDASGNVFPVTGGSGTGGAIRAGDLYFVSVPGILAGKPTVVGDSFFAVVNAPGQSSANWCVLDTNLGYVPEEAGAASAAIAAHILAADPHGDRAYSVQRGNHTGTQLASSISDFATAAKSAVVGVVNGLIKADGSGNLAVAVAGTDYVKTLYEQLAGESWLIEDFLGYYGTAAWQQAGTNYSRVYNTGESVGLGDGIGVLTMSPAANSAGGAVSCGWGVSNSMPTFQLKANPLILVASVSIGDFGAGSSSPGASGPCYFFNLGTFLYSTAPGAFLTPSSGITLVIFKDLSGNIKAQAVTTSAYGDGTKTDDYLASVTLSTNTRINVVIVASNTYVRYYINGVLFREVSNIAKLPLNVGLLGQVGWNTALGSNVGSMSYDLVKLGRKFITPRALQLPII